MSEISVKKKRRTTGRKAWWAEQISACEKSGMSMVAYAKANNLNLSSLYNWKTALRHEKKKGTIRSIEKTKPIQFLEVLVNDPKSDAIVEIASPGGWKVRVPSSMDAETTSRFVGVVEGRA